MHSVPDEAAFIAPSYVIIIATIVVISTVIDCSKRKELSVQPTQVSMGEHSKIYVFSREGETDIEIPSHLNKLKEQSESKKSDRRESSEVKKLDDKDKKEELGSNLISKESEKYRSNKEKHSRKEEMTAKDDNRNEEAKDKDEKFTKRTQPSDMKRYNHENEEKSAEK
ncbi:hypothetical protein X798_01297 [Onchocerca flexuosa]|uniref:Uncharacterized protein n=2 Tax=Onchocerca flexuosa TaxID=387005 RepID=A0A183HUX8_9BILA|nr:hypothetical protein X798_01297 [Onchocerca flexuosa]VDO75369.1 unnamed protein product [Onchocerca flexuosa]